MTIYNETQAKKFRDFGGPEEWRDWEIVLAGDFNTQPMEIAYSLILSDTLDPVQSDLLRRSTVVHHSVDKKYDPDYVSPDYVPPELRVTPDEVEGDEAGEVDDEDKTVRNSREGRAEDGLIGLEEFKTLFNYLDPDASYASNVPAGSFYSSRSLIEIKLEFLNKRITRSAYGSIGHHFADNFAGNYYFNRSPGVHTTKGCIVPEDVKTIERRKAGGIEERIRRGDFEPQWTNFTPLWRCTLEYVSDISRSIQSLYCQPLMFQMMISYIFLLPHSNLSKDRAPSQFTGLLQMHTAQDMAGGLPRRGVGASDHESLGAVLEIHV